MSTLMLALMSVVSLLAPPQRPTVDQLLDHYCRVEVSSLARDSEAEVRANSRAPFAQIERESVEALQLRFDGKRFELISSTSVSAGEAGQNPPPFPADSRILWDGHTLYRDSIPPGSDEMVLQILASTDAKRVLSHHTAAPLDGHFPGDDRPISEILREIRPTVRIREALEKVGAHDCAVIESESKYGHIILWLDPEYDYCIVRAIVEKRGDDVWYGAKLSRVPDLPEKLKAIADPTVVLPKIAVRFELSNVALKKTQNRWVPMACTYSRRIDYGEGRTAEDVVTVTRKKIEIMPKFEANAFRPDYPDGIRILKPGMGQIQLEWRGGQIVPVVDEDTIKQIDRDVQHNR